MTLLTQNGADDNSLSNEELDDGTLACHVWPEGEERRRDGRPSRRPRLGRVFHRKMWVPTNFGYWLICLKHLTTCLSTSAFYCNFMINGKNDWLVNAMLAGTG